MAVTTNPFARLRYVREKIEGVRPAGVLGAPTPAAEIRRALILESDRTYGDMLVALVKSTFAAATVVLTACLGDLEGELREGGADLLVLSAIASGGDVLESLSGWRSVTRGAILLVTSRPAPAMLAAISEQPISGIFDRAGGTMVDLRVAIEDVARGVRYFSPVILERLFSECVDQRSPYAGLTRTERMVLGVIGDGSDDGVAAGLLSMSQATVKSVRREIHRKLGVHHRGELQARAAALGFVLHTPYGVLRPGFLPLLNARGSVRPGAPRRPSHRAA